MKYKELRTWILPGFVSLIVHLLLLAYFNYKITSIKESKKTLSPLDIKYVVLDRKCHINSKYYPKDTIDSTIRPKYVSASLMPKEDNTKNYNPNLNINLPDTSKDKKFSLTQKSIDVIILEKERTAYKYSNKKKKEQKLHGVSNKLHKKYIIEPINYRYIVANKIKNHIPEFPEEWDFRGVVEVKIDIRKDGTVKDIIFISRSRNYFLNQAVVYAIRKAAPFPPLDPRLQISHLPFRYRFIKK